MHIVYRSTNQARIRLTPPARLAPAGARPDLGDRRGSLHPNAGHIPVSPARPDDVRQRVSDIQYVLELSSGSSDVDPPAKFTAPPPEGGIGCEGRRTHGKVGRDEAAAMFTINDDASHLSR